MNCHDLLTGSNQSKWAAPDVSIEPELDLKWKNVILDNINLRFSVIELGPKASNAVVKHLRFEPIDSVNISL